MGMVYAESNDQREARLQQVREPLAAEITEQGEAKLQQVREQKGEWLALPAQYINTMESSGSTGAPQHTLHDTSNFQPHAQEISLLDPLQDIL